MKGCGEKAKFTVYIKLIMPQKEYPQDNKIKLFHEQFDMKTYVDKPWQCYRRQPVGHNAKYCTRLVKCVICAEKHAYKDCSNKSELEKVRCANRGMNHTSSYGGCRYIRAAIKSSGEGNILRNRNNISNKATHQNLVRQDMLSSSSSNFGRTENMVSYSAVAGRNQQARNSYE